MTTTAPRATILVPVLQQNDLWLAQSVRSALTQTVPCEVIVIVAERTPPSNRTTLQQLAQEYPQLRILEQPRPGFAAALNFGVAEAKSEKIGFLLSDDWLDPMAVEACLPHEVDITCTSLRIWFDDGRTLEPLFFQYLCEKDFGALPNLERKARYLCHFFMFAKRKLQEVGGLDEMLGDAPGIDDYDLIWVLLERGASVAIIEKVLYHYRDHDFLRLTLGKREQMSATYFRILEKHHVPPERQQELHREASVWFGRSVKRVARLLKLTTIER